jgi:hypothetical protein
LTYEQMLAEVDATVAKTASSARRDAWVVGLKAHQGQPDQGDYEAADRRYVR